MAVAAPKDLDLLIVGAGPCGLAAAISAQRAGLKARVLDANCVVSTITQYPYYVNFFSTAEKLSLGGIPFVVATEKPTRRDSLAYYRAVVRHFALDVRQYERVSRVEKVGDAFVVVEGVARCTSYLGTLYPVPCTHLCRASRTPSSRTTRLARSRRMTTWP